MDVLNSVCDYFEKSLTLINELNCRADFLEEKIKQLRALNSDDELFKECEKILETLRAKSKKVNEMLSALACNLSSGDEYLTEALDTVYLNQKKKICIEEPAMQNDIILQK